MKFVKKFFKIVLIAFLAMLVAMGGLVLFMNSANGDKGDNKTVLASVDENAPKALVVYQPSISKNSDKVAKAIAQGLNEKGYEVTLNYPGKHLDTSLSEYDLVVFGSVVYAGQPAKALADYMATVKAYAPRVALFSVGGLDQSPELDALEKLVVGSSVESKTKFTTKNQDMVKEAKALGLSLASR
ncbi:MAG: flavodoxin domain-containing protein [Clostridia bacterium]|nr:flavodoxin domain-containing protein [Clostridia bacterium]